MPISPAAVQTVTVDSYGTLVDTGSVTEQLATVVDDPDLRSVSRLWRLQSLLYTMVANAIDAYQPFYEMNRDALAYALNAHGVDHTPAERDAVLAAYHDLEAFAGVRDGIERLRAAGYEVYVVSNGNPEMLASMAESAGIDDLVTDTVSAHEIERFKPAPSVYRHAAARTGTPIERILHLAAPVFDVQGAMHAGMHGAWLDRGDTPWGRFDGDPDLVVDSVPALADVLA